MLLMDCSFIYKTILLASLWNTLGFFGFKGLSLCYSKLRITNKIWCLLASNLLRVLIYSFCATVLALNLATVSRTELWKIIINPKLHSTYLLIENTEDLPLIEDIFVFVFSFFFMHLHKVISLNNFKSHELRRSTFLIVFLLSGYYCKFLGMTFFIGTLFSIFLAFQSVNRSLVMKRNEINSMHFAKKFIMLFLFLVWAYLFAYVIPVHCLYPIMVKDATGVESRFCFNVFKTSFGFYYFAEICSSTFIQNIRWFIKKFASSYAKLFFSVYCQYYGSRSDIKLRSDESEEALKIGARKKSPQEIKTQAELMQMVKCVVAIRKKLKRAKENREK